MPITIIIFLSLSATAYFYRRKVKGVGNMIKRESWELHSACSAATIIVHNTCRILQNGSTSDPQVRAIPSRIIESCSQGGAYKASFQDGTVAVVKEVRALSQGEDVFHREVQLLAQLHHRHLVALQGFSLGHKRFLVFEKTENGSLKEHLSDPLKTPLNWRTRLQIAIGVAAALLSDVGLLSSDGNRGTSLHSSCSEDCMGQKCGNTMFQLGVLILELVTGQSSEKGGTDIIQWVQESCFGITIDNMIDPDLGNNYDPGELRSLLAVARFCLKSRDKPTYSVSHILRYLQKKLDSSCNAF
ncbi:probable receptor-like protein kinase At1g49730 isoform X2 [Malania oleifera]|uniref:probable receptor-like protein kinase At1g49730 isoform X2 n=1 Tax=Malania oleifera TaxID=397392 RepID=UPI0025ADE706|nr:probable receptor-like protein kinase At1g49730 isoform X2 [Malania oleifera]